MANITRSRAARDLKRIIDSGKTMMMGSGNMKMTASENTKTRAKIGTPMTILKFCQSNKNFP
jgi:hypothetical protein